MESIVNSIVTFWENNRPFFFEMGRKLIIAVLIIAAGRIIIVVTRKLTEKAVSGKLHFDETLASVLRTVIKYAVVIICLIMILEDFGVNTTSLVAVLGAAGIAVGFALKDTLSNIAAGLINLILRPFKQGDFIECASIMGTVKEMGLFATIMETPDGIFISAPNSSLWGVPLKNYSHNTQRRMEISIVIQYTDSIDTAFQVFKEIIAAESRFLKDPKAQVIVQSLGENGTGIALRAWVRSDNYWPVYWDQMKNVKEKIQEAGLTIAFPKRELHFIKDAKGAKGSPGNLVDLSEQNSL